MKRLENQITFLSLSWCLGHFRRYPHDHRLQEESETGSADSPNHQCQSERSCWIRTLKGNGFLELYIGGGAIRETHSFRRMEPNHSLCFAEKDLVIARSYSATSPTSSRAVGPSIEPIATTSCEADGSAHCWTTRTKSVGRRRNFWLKKNLHSRKTTVRSIVNSWEKAALLPWEDRAGEGLCFFRKFLNGFFRTCYTNWRIRRVKGGLSHFSLMTSKHRFRQRSMHQSATTKDIEPSPSAKIYLAANWPIKWQWKIADPTGKRLLQPEIDNRNHPCIRFCLNISPFKSQSGFACCKFIFEPSTLCNPNGSQRFSKCSLAWWIFFFHRRPCGDRRKQDGANLPIEDLDGLFVALDMDLTIPAVLSLPSSPPRLHYLMDEWIRLVQKWVKTKPPVSMDLPKVVFSFSQRLFRVYFLVSYLISRLVWRDRNDHSITVAQSRQCKLHSQRTVHASESLHIRSISFKHWRA